MALDSKIKTDRSMLRNYTMAHWAPLDVDLEVSLQAFSPVELLSPEHWREKHHVALTS